MDMNGWMDGVEVVILRDWLEQSKNMNDINYIYLIT
jgi:hypothetical protein